MNNKFSLILAGTLVLLVSTMLKSKLYVIDILQNFVAFIMFLFIFSFVVRSKREGRETSYLYLYTSLICFLIYSILFSPYLLLIILFLYFLIFQVYRFRKMDTLTEIPVVEKSFYLHFQKNRKYYKIQFLLFLCVLYYVSFIYLLNIGLVVVSSDFW